MWKKAFQKKENSEFALLKKNACDYMLIEEDTIQNKQDLLTLDVSKWTTENVQEFLGSSPKALPFLKEITKIETNPWGGVPYMLCTFENKNSTCQIWISSALLYHITEYKDMYLDFRNNQSESISSLST